MKLPKSKNAHSHFHSKHSQSAYRQRLKSLLFGVGLASATFAFPTGCTRSYYRSTADSETNCLIDQKNAVAALPPVRRVPVDRSSRMFDPFNPDRPPMPEDDPTAHRYMQRVDGKKHYPLWDVNGKTNTTESPDWWQLLPLDERGVLVLDSNTAVRLAAIHSTLYQSEIETLYLSALDVSSERFLLDNQFYAGSQVDYVADGPARRGAGGQSRSNLSTGTFNRTGRRGLSWQRRFASGTDLVVGFANSMTWQLSGPDTQSATTLLDFSLIQPLLRGGGRDVILERLTLAERTLLQNVRAFERFKTGYYVTVTAGRAAEPGPSRRGGLFGGAGLEGFTGLGGGFGTVGNVQQTQRNANNAGGFGGGGAVPNAGGILGLIQTQLQIKNAEENISRLKDNLLRFEDALREQLTKIAPSQDTIPSQQLQVAQARQALVSAQAQLLSSRATYEVTLDTFKTTLGLPPYLCVEIRDPLLDQFILIGSDLIKRRAEVATLRDQVGQSNTNLLNLSESKKDAATGQSYRTIEKSAALKENLESIGRATESISKTRLSIVEQDIPTVERDLEKLRATIPQRQKQLARLREIYETERELICTLLPSSGLDDALFSTVGLEALPDLLTSELAKLKERMQGYATQLGKLQSDLKLLSDDKAVDQKSADSSTATTDRSRSRFDGVRDGAILQSQDLLAALSEDVLALQVLQARTRTESVLLPEVDISQQDAIKIAQRNRLDWMNARTSLVDSWRAIEVVADDLESYLDVVFSGDMQNRTDNPFSLQGRTGRLRVGLQWDSPLTRLQERNRYRQVLIEYQQNKRAYYLFEDAVWQTLRSQLRNIRFSQYNFELQRYAVRVAADQILVNEDLRQIRETLSQASGPTAARDSVSALNDLLQAQNTFLNVWVFYESQRRNLDQDLGTMQVDAEGIWCDPGKITAERYLVEGQTLFAPENSIESPTPFDLQPIDAAPPIPNRDQFGGDVSVAPTTSSGAMDAARVPVDLSSQGVVAPAQEIFEQATGR